MESPSAYEHILTYEFFSWLAIFSNLSYPLFGLGQRLQLSTPHKQIKLAAAPTSSVASCSREPSGPIVSQRPLIFYFLFVFE